MSLFEPLSRERALVAAGLYVSAAAAGVVAWTHAHAVGGAGLFVCGAGADAHCWACYAAPALGLAGVSSLLGPEARRAPARAR